MVRRAFTQVLLLAASCALGACAGEPRSDDGARPTSASQRLYPIQARDGTRLELAIPSEFRADDDAKLVRWTQRAVRSIEAYYGRFPMERVSVDVLAGSGDAVANGRSTGTDHGARIVVRVGRATSSATLDRDWTLTHEMVHLALPSLAPEHHWLEEGTATWVEPIARCQAGILDPQELWSETLELFPQGLPESGDRGLDGTRAWGRTYYGGAIFCLLAEIEIRERTSNRRSLQDALRAIVAAGGNIAETWDIERVLRVGDEALGEPVLEELYARMAHDPAPVDLDALWKKLGVSLHEGKVEFDDAAPLAALRRAMTQSPQTAEATPPRPGEPSGP